MGKIKGYVAEGFEPVRDQLEKMIQSGCEDHLQLCVYLDKKCIIDLHGSFCENSVYNSDSMQVNMYSTYYFFRWSGSYKREIISRQLCLKVSS